MIFFRRKLPSFFNRDELYDFEDEFGGDDFYEEWVEPSVLLLQLDSGSGDVDILWGDCGIGNFFICPDDLKKADFSRVVYNRDCT
ncbi:TPA: DUF1963 domain-containing protein [Morganella morganii]